MLDKQQTPLRKSKDCTDSDTCSVHNVICDSFNTRFSRIEALIGGLYLLLIGKMLLGF